MQDEKVKIIEVAFDTGYESVDGYQRAFYKEFGCNPYEYSVCPTPIYLFKPYGIKYAQKKEKAEMSEVKSVFLQVVDKPGRKVIIKRGKEAKEKKLQELEEQAKAEAETKAKTEEETENVSESDAETKQEESEV